MKKKTENSRSVRFQMLALVLMPLGLLIYSGALGAPFVYDDRGYILDNNSITDLANFLDLSGTRYVGFLSFAINYAIGGFTPFDYHLTNVLIHIINSILVFSLVLVTAETPLLRNTAQRDGSYRTLVSALAFSASVIFLVHPLETQAVTYVTQRFASLATMFYLLSVVLYAKSRLAFESSPTDGVRFPIKKWTLYVLSLFSVVLAMKTKEISFTIPFVIALYEKLFFNVSAEGERKRISPYFRLPFYLTLLIIPITLVAPDMGFDNGWRQAGSITEEVRVMQMKEAAVLSRYVYLSTQFNVIVTYLRLLVWPVGQSVDWHYPLSKSFFEPRTMVCIAFLLSILGVAVWNFFRSRRTGSTAGVFFSFGIFWFFITLSVESFLVPIQDVIFEHRAYLPSVGFFISALSALHMVLNYFRERFHLRLSNFTASLGLLFVVVPLLSYGVYKRNILWNDEVLLVNEAIEKSPGKHRLYYARALAYLDRKEYSLALKDAEKVLELSPLSFNGYNMRGIVRASLGMYAEAVGDFSVARELNPSDFKNLHNRGLSYAALGSLESAIRDYTSAIELNPKFALAYNDRGVALSRLGFINKGMSDFRIACSLGNPKGCNNVRVLIASADAKRAGR